MSDGICIEKTANGFTVAAQDPDIVKSNAKSKGAWKNPERTYVFKTADEVLGFLKTNLDKALPDDEYESAFDEALEDDGGDDD